MQKVTISSFYMPIGYSFVIHKLLWTPLTSMTTIFSTVWRNWNTIREWEVGVLKIWWFTTTSWVQFRSKELLYPQYWHEKVLWQWSNDLDIPYGGIIRSTLGANFAKGNYCILIFRTWSICMVPIGFVTVKGTLLSLSL